MSSEDKIIAAIDRNTEAIERQNAWLMRVEEDGPLLNVLEDVKVWLRLVFIVICFTATVLLAVVVGKAAPLVSDGDEIKAGIKQECCRICKRWYFPQEPHCRGAA